METYAYVWVAERFGVPIRVLKSVSDRAQDGAIDRLARNRDRLQRTSCASACLADYGV